ncbi:MAG: trigger factor [Candidatus Margulisiibacteriota bacterium]|jgi:trigger factor
MKILKSKRENDIYSLEIEESPDQLTPHLDVAFKKLVQNVKLPGFRPGKITRAIFEKHFGKEPLIEEAMLYLTNTIYSNAITELNLKVVDYPKNIQINEYKEDQPIKFSCEVAVLPQVKLGRYKGLKAKKEKITVTEEDVTAFINTELEKKAQFLPVERAAATGDVVRINIEAKIDGSPYENWIRQNLSILIGSSFFGPDFDAALVGLSKNENKSFIVKYADDFSYQEVAGKEVEFLIDILEVLEKKLPDLTDEYVKENFKIETVKEFKENLFNNMKMQKETDIKRKLEDELITQIIADIKVTIHESMINKEVEARLKDFENKIKQYKISLEEYLKYNNKHIDDIKSELTVAAEKAIKSDLVIQEICEKENIKASEEELNAEIQKYNLPEVTNAAEFRTKYNPIFLENIEQSIKERKFFEYIIKEAKLS